MWKYFIILNECFWKISHHFVSYFLSCQYRADTLDTFAGKVRTNTHRELRKGYHTLHLATWNLFLSLVCGLRLIL